MTNNLLNKFLNEHNYDIRQSRNGRWIDQKCTMDELCFVADCVVVYLQDGGKQPFQSPDIWHTAYAIENVQRIFCKPDPTDDTTIDEYNKFFRQPLKMLSAAGILREEGKKNNAIQFSVVNEAILDFLSLRERNCLDFLCSYIKKTLEDSGLWDAFESFFDEQTKEQYDNVKKIFHDFCIRYTPIQNNAEPNRIFTKVLNPLAVWYKKKGSVKGSLSQRIITLEDIKYNRTNFRDKNKDKNISRQQAQSVDNIQENVCDYKVEKAKRRLRKFNDQFNNGLSEITDALSIGQKATHMHHIFPKNEFPNIADYVENLIALTAGQHLQKAHPAGNTKIIDKDFQYICLLNKTESIRRNLVEKKGDVFYDFPLFMLVLDVGLRTDFFEKIPENDFVQVVSGIEINFPNK
ncbi:hypothetical protein SAMN05720473_1132 [Fibrobacter sp. UWB15]|uniref:restriction endonuclease n=1 Tax=unclassified Fibrobacter TaxID=2634177 RepID=UPI000918D765|nr:MULTISPECIES: restriction endonuclease [unclassified Fibrobacter]PWJ61925.1 hypothetical protein BGW99_1142 [Fibrobacter sp. UWB6]SHG58519.1 hypothetical protein SAMN05720760_11553 [Fibrobacter sp. UWB8]SMG41887.1 hypothetical protein SAMN05720473_1132 [Fibrobacter sp. UWB15]